MFTSISCPDHSCCVSNISFSPNNSGNTRLSTFDLSSNQFRGPLKDSFLGMASLRDLDMSRNSFTGVLPISLGSLPNLGSLKLQFNQFEGEVPDGYCGISRLEADCLSQVIVIEIPEPENTISPQFHPGTFCPAPSCCTTCCDRLAGVCEDYIGEGISPELSRCDGFIDWDPRTGEVTSAFL